MRRQGIEAQAVCRQPIPKSDIVVAVKGFDFNSIDPVRDCVVIVYDILDAWKQTPDMEWVQKGAVEWLRRHIARVNPDAMVFPTKQMQTDAAFDGPSLVLPHHARPSQKRNPIRPRVVKVGYEGDIRYLGPWRTTLERECMLRDWEFVHNPPSLADLDIVVALRGGVWDGYPSRRWKSGVKLANAIATGTPVICGLGDGYREIETGGEFWAGSEAAMDSVLDILSSQSERRWRSDVLYRFAPRVDIDTLAGQYLTWLRGLLG